MINQLNERFTVEEEVAYKKKVTSVEYEKKETTEERKPNVLEVEKESSKLEEYLKSLPRYKKNIESYLKLMHYDVVYDHSVEPAKEVLRTQGLKEIYSVSDRDIITVCEEKQDNGEFERLFSHIEIGSTKTNVIASYYNILSWNHDASKKLWTIELTNHNFVLYDVKNKRQLVASQKLPKYAVSAAFTLPDESSSVDQYVYLTATIQKGYTQDVVTIAIDKDNLSIIKMRSNRIPSWVNVDDGNIIEKIDELYGKKLNDLDVLINEIAKIPSADDQLTFLYAAFNDAAYRLGFEINEEEKETKDEIVPQKTI